MLGEVEVVQLRLIYISFIILIGGPHILGAEESFSRVSIADNYHLLNRQEKDHLHLLILKLLNKRTKEQKFEKKKYQELFTHNPIEFLDFFIVKSYANTEAAVDRCNFGGWISTLDNMNQCEPPWRRSVRDNPRLLVFGDTYTREYSCGGANLFRCNPLIFGLGEDGKGICASTDDSDSNESTNSCLSIFLNSEGATRAVIDNLEKNPDQLASYLAIVAETLHFCQINVLDFPYCDDLNATLLNISRLSVMCTDQQELLSYLPDIVTPFNLDELDSITNGLGTAAIKYAEDLTKRQQEIRLKNRTVYQEAISAYQQDSRLISTIQRIRDNSDKCIMDSCDGTRHSRSKPQGTSLAWCARYVKFAMYPPRGTDADSYGSFEEYPWGSDGVESGDWLKKDGFVNLMDIPEMSHLTPETAPIGSIIVYEKTAANRRNRYNVDGVNRGGPGQVEIKASENEYISDFINDEPTTVGGDRRAIGIYVQIPPEFESQIQEIPER